MPLPLDQITPQRQNWTPPRRGFTPFRTFGNEAVPEPGTWMEMILGFGIIGGVMRRRDGEVLV